MQITITVTDMKIKVLLSAISLLAFLPLQAQDIDFPLSQSEIEKYESRVRMQRLPDVNITHADAYRIETQQPVYSPQTKQIMLDVINVDGPTAEPEYHHLKQWKNGKWVKFPFIDNLVFRCRQGFIQGRHVAQTYPYV